ncbi:hypothetical protein PTTG_29222 [Puccinia triticina 1-1 BBBD Race 1]|uniref:Uncharacterized protein n=2 Tax=Puccinia triticina TaxID=208348 RepID=A0A180G5H9_PUCT1|nr:uncharacterized protein PtA15_16A113 [Puccinia triticina]OAV87945.1 hypothetical protein PTTG_29222 [Puccinia triticina 1-1 BBBD Race 1]WAQ92207.1 hypothetical protein PtA15_16A113 [Puccinia triticina]WAR63946.1 hypothetical protein PtB15_16B105 [Puccinia triticina]
MSQPKRSSTPDAGASFTPPTAENRVHAAVADAEGPPRRPAHRISPTNTSPRQNLRRSRRIFDRKNGSGSFSVSANYLSLAELKKNAKAEESNAKAEGSKRPRH